MLFDISRRMALQIFKTGKAIIDADLIRRHYEIPEKDELHILREEILDALHGVSQTTDPDEKTTICGVDITTHPYNGIVIEHVELPKIAGKNIFVFSGFHHTDDNGIIG